MKNMRTDDRNKASSPRVFVAAMDRALDLDDPFGKRNSHV